MITTELQGFLFVVIKFVSDIAMLILLIRYVAAPFLYTQAGPFLQAINQAAMGMSRPFHRVTYWIGFRKSDVSPLAAILAILVVRGALFTLVPASFGASALDRMALLWGQQQSFVLGCTSLLRLTALVLFFSIMFAKAGGFYGSVFFRVVDDVAAAVFGHVRKVLHLKNLWALLAGGLAYVCLMYAAALCLLWWDIHFPFFWAQGALTALAAILYAMIILTFIFIAVSWISLFSAPEESNRAWLFLQAMVRPALERCRRLLPWARIGMLDLSPMAFFLALFLGLAIVGMFQRLVVQSLAGSGGMVPF